MQNAGNPGPKLAVHPGLGRPTPLAAGVSTNGDNWGFAFDLMTVAFLGHGSVPLKRGSEQLEQACVPSSFGGGGGHQREVHGPGKTDAIAVLVDLVEQRKCLRSDRNV